MRMTGLEDAAEHAMEHASRLAATATVSRDVLIAYTMDVFVNLLNAPERPRV